MTLGVFRALVCCGWKRRSSGVFWWISGEEGLSLSLGIALECSVLSPGELPLLLLSFPPEIHSDLPSFSTLNPDHSSLSFAGLRPMNAAERRWQEQGRRSGARQSGLEREVTGRGRVAGGEYCCSATREEVRRTKTLVDCSCGLRFKKRRNRVMGW